MSTTIVTNPTLPETTDDPALDATWWLRLEWLLAGLILLAHTPFVVQHFVQLWQFRPHYEFFPFALATVAYLAWQRWPRGGVKQTLWTRLLSRLLLLLGLITLTAAVVLFSPWLGAIAAIFSIGGLVLAMAGRVALRDLLPVWLLLWIVIPPPSRLDDDLVRTLQSTTARTSSSVLELIGVPHLLMGNVVRVPDREFFVAEACSGLHSQLVLIAACLIYAVAVRRSLLHTLLLTAAAVLWSAAMNILRVIMIVFLADKFHVDLSTGWQHEVLGFALIAVGCLLLVSTDRFLSGMLGAVLDPAMDWDFDGADSSDEKYPRALDRLSRLWNFVFAQNPTALPDQPAAIDNRVPLADRSGDTPLRLTRGMVVALIGFCSLGWLQPLMMMAPNKVELDPGDLVSAFQAESLPSKVGDWRRIGYLTEERERSSDEGQCSRIWQYEYETGDHVAQVSADFPFKGWHELTLCYKAIGWREVSRTVRTIPNSNDPQNVSVAEDASIVEVELEKPTGEVAFLQFSLFDGGGGTITPESSNWKGWRVKLAASPLVQLMRNGYWGAGASDTTIQFQQFVESGYRFNDDQRKELRDLFLQLRGRFRSDMLASAGDR